MVTAISPFVGKQDLHGVHPLTLLQGYSNADKHRAIRLTSGRTIPFRRSPGKYDITMHQVDAGFVIAEGLPTSSREVDATSAVHVQRPDGSVWVPPGAELAQIHNFVSDIAIPTLISGGPASPDIPRKVILDDTGVSITEGSRQVAPSLPISVSARRPLRRRKNWMPNPLRPSRRRARLAVNPARSGDFWVAQEA